MDMVIGIFIIVIFKTVMIDSTSFHEYVFLFVFPFHSKLVIQPNLFQHHQLQTINVVRSNWHNYYSQSYLRLPSSCIYCFNHHSWWLRYDMDVLLGNIYSEQVELLASCESTSESPLLWLQTLMCSFHPLSSTLNVFKTFMRVYGSVNFLFGQNPISIDPRDKL